MGTLLEEYFRIYSKLAPEIFNNDKWAYLCLTALCGIFVQLIAYFYLSFFKNIKDSQKRINTITTFTAILAFLISVGDLWINERLQASRVFACFLLSLFIWSLRYFSKIAGKDFEIDLKSDLKLKHQENKKGFLRCPGCNSLSIASMNVAHTPQTCGECERLIYLDREAYQLFNYFWIGYSLSIFSFLFLKYSLNYWNVFLNWLLIAVLFGGMASFAFFVDRIKAKCLKIKSPS